MKLHASIFFCVFLWGTSYVAITIGLADFTPMELAAGRFGMAAILLIPVLILRKTKLPDWKTLLAITVVSTIGIVGYQIALNYALLYHHPSLVSFVTNAIPIFVALIGFFVLSESLNAWGWMGLVLGLLGVFIMNLPLNDIKIEEVIILLICPVTAAIFYVLQKPLTRHIAAIDLMMFQIVIGGIVLLTIDPSFLKSAFSASMVPMLATIYLAVFPTIVALLIWAWVLTVTEVTYASGYIFLVPLSTLFTAYLLLGQSPDWRESLGGLFILSGVHLLHRTKTQLSPNS